MISVTLRDVSGFVEKEVNNNLREHHMDDLFIKVHGLLL